MLLMGTRSGCSQPLVLADSERLEVAPPRLAVGFPGTDSSVETCIGTRV